MSKLEEALCYALVAIPVVMAAAIPPSTHPSLDEAFAFIVFIAIGTVASFRLVRQGGNRYIAWVSFSVYCFLVLGGIVSGVGYWIGLF